MATPLLTNADFLTASLAEWEAHVPDVGHSVWQRRGGEGSGRDRLRHHGRAGGHVTTATEYGVALRVGVGVFPSCLAATSRTEAGDVRKDCGHLLLPHLALPDNGRGKRGPLRNLSSHGLDASNRAKVGSLHFAAGHSFVSLRRKTLILTRLETKG
jgi:hypothetical protein